MSNKFSFVAVSPFEYLEITVWNRVHILQRQLGGCRILRMERIPVRSSHNILPMEGLAAKITSSLHESNFACYNCINGITSTADEYSFTSYNCISNITICGRTVEEDYPMLELPGTNHYIPHSSHVYSFMARDACGDHVMLLVSNGITLPHKPRP